MHLINAFTILAYLAATSTGRLTESVTQKHTLDANQSLVTTEDQSISRHGRQAISNHPLQDDQPPSVEVVLQPSFNTARLQIIPQPCETAVSGSFVNTSRLESCQIMEASLTRRAFSKASQNGSCEDAAPIKRRDLTLDDHEKHYQQYEPEQHQVPIFGEEATPALRDQQIQRRKTKHHQELIVRISQNTLTRANGQPQNDTVYSYEAVLISLEAVFDYFERTSSQNLVLKLDPLGYVNDTLALSFDGLLAAAVEGVVEDSFWMGIVHFFRDIWRALLGVISWIFGGTS